MTWTEENKKYLRSLQEKAAQKKIKEELNELTSFLRVEKEIKRNKNFRNLMNTKLKDLDPKMEYSFDSNIWNEHLDDTFYDFLFLEYGNNTNFKVYISEESENLRGWVAYQVDPSEVYLYNIKMGSFVPDDPRENLKFISELESFFEEALKKYQVITWRALPSNKKVFKFYKRLIDKNKGRSHMSVSHFKDDDYWDFALIGDSFFKIKENIIENIKRE